MQTREDWLRWRKQGIGSSDAPAVIGKSRFKTPRGLYEDKISDEIVETNSYITDKGNEFEPKIRSWVEIQRMKSFKEARRQLAPPYDHLRASYDGLSECNTEILEAKVLGLEPWERLKKDGAIPEDYIPQCLHLLTCEPRAQVLHFAGYLYVQGEMRDFDPSRMAMVSIQRFDVLEQMYDLFQRCNSFWNRYVKCKIPPPLCDDDFKMLKGAAPIANVIAKNEDKIIALKRQAEAGMKDLIELAEKSGHRYVYAGQYELVKENNEWVVTRKEK